MFERVFDESNEFGYNSRFRALQQIAEDMELEDEGDDPVRSAYTNYSSREINRSSIYDQMVVEGGESGLRASVFSGVRSSSDMAVKRMFESFDVTKRPDRTDDRELLDVERERVRSLRNQFVGFLTGGQVPENEEIFQSFDRMARGLEYLSRNDLAAATRNSWNTVSQIDRYLGNGMERTKAIVNRLSRPEMTFEEVQEGIRQIQNDMASSRNTMDRLVQEGYYSRPGTMPALGLIASSGSFLDIDMYQLQNRSIKDHLITTVSSKAASGEPFTLRVRMAFPRNTDSEKTSFDILGPNLNTLRELELLGEVYRDRPNIRIQVEVGDKGNHPKVMVSDLGFTIGSQNLTSPVGNSPFTSGSNFEALRVVKLSEIDKRKLDGFLTGSPFRKDEYEGLSASGKMYVQARSVMNRVFDKKEKFTATGMQNIGGPEEAYEFYKVAAQKLKEGRGQFIGVLDQIFLLKYDTPYIRDHAAGEMGRFTDGELSDPLFTAYREQRADKFRQDIQRPFAEAVIGGKARFVVDTKNYLALEQGIYGTDGAVRAILDRNQFTPEALVTAGVRGAHSVTDKITNLTAYLSRESPNLNRTEAEAKAVQLLMMTSGNIEKARVPRQHVKAGVFIDNYSDNVAMESLNILANIMGSSNPGMWALSPGDDVAGFNQKYSNFELNQILALNQFRSASAKLRTGYGLGNEEQEEINESGQFIVRMFRELRGQIDNSFSRRPSYESVVDSAEILSIERDLREMGARAGNEGMFAPFTTGGMSTFINRDDRGRPVNIQVTIGAGIPGIRSKTFKYAPLKGPDGKPGFIFSVNEGRLINSIEVGNLGSSDLYTSLADSDGSSLVLRPGERTTLPPRQALLSMMASMQVGAASTALISGPYSYFQEMQQQGAGRVEYAIAKYLVNRFDMGSIAPENLFDPNIVSAQVIAEKSLTGILGRLTSASRDLDVVRQLAGINPADPNRVVRIKGLASTVAGMASQNNSAARDMLFRGATSNYGIKNVVDSIIQLINTDPQQYADLIYDIVSAQGDIRYKQNLQETIKDLFTQISSDPHTVQAQANLYSATQARDKRLFYGITDDPTKQAFAREVGAGAATRGSMKALYGSALMLSPMEFGPTSFLGRHKHDNIQRSILYVDIAEGGSARFEPDDIDRELMEGYDQLTPMKHSKTGDVIDLIPLMQNAGVGHYLDLDKSFSMYVGYLRAAGYSDNQANEIARLRAQSFRNLYGESTKDILMFNFDTLKKGTQILQRLKNVKGSRPMAESSREYFNVLQKGGFTGDSIGGVPLGTTRTFYNSNDLQTGFVEGLRDQLRAQIGNMENITSVIGDELGIAALRAGDIKSFISQEQGALLTSVKRDVLQELGIEETSISSTLLYSVIRAKLIHLENIYSPVRGLIGAGDDGDRNAVTLMMFGGAASDPFFYNPAYRKGEVMGVYSDRAVKGVRSSLLRATVSSDDLNKALDLQSWRFDEKLIPRSGAVLKFDRGSGKTYLTTTDSSGKETVLATVDSRKEFQTITDVMQRASGLNSFGYVSATSSASRFSDEGGMEVLREVKILPADLATNELQVELIFDRLIGQGTGGRRIEALGGLGKAVTMTPEQSFFEEILSQVNNYRADKLELEQVQGLMSVTNFKSYRFDHGAAILGNQDKLNNLLGMDPRRLAISVLSLADVGHLGANEAIAQNIYTEVYRLAGDREFSSFLNETAALGMLTLAKRKGEQVYSYEAEVGRNALLAADYRVGGKEKTVNQLKANMPTLFSGITPEAIFLALSAGQGDMLRQQLERVLYLPDELRVFNRSIVSDPSGRAREAALVAGQLDLFNEVLSAKRVNVRMGFTQDPTTYAAMAASAGFNLSEIQAGLEKGAEQEYYQEMLGEMINSGYIARMYSPFLFSQSKVAASTKSGVRLESQHILPESFSIQTKPFVAGGVVDQVRNLFNLSISMVSGLSTGQLRSRIGNLPVFDVSDPYIQSSAFRSKAIGVYAGDSLKFNVVRSEYNFYSVLVDYLSAVRGSSDLTKVKADIESLLASNKLGKGASRNDIVQIRGILNQLDSQNINTLKELAYLGMQKGQLGLKELDDSFNLMYSDKPVGIGELEASVRGLEQTGLKTVGIRLPAMEFEGNQVRIRSGEAGPTAILYSGELIRLMGEQYGGFESELARTNIELVRALAPGSRLFELIHTISQRMRSGQDFVMDDLSQSDLTALQELSALPHKQQEQILERMAGISMQAQVGSKQSVQGNTFVAGASPLVPSGTMVGATLLDNRFGTEGLSTRLAAIQSLNRVGRDLLNLEREDLADRALSRRAIRFQNAQTDLLNTGISQAARIDLEKLINFSSKVSQLISEGGELKELNILIEEKRREISQMLIPKNSSGDRFVKVLAQEELSLLDLMIQRAEIKDTQSLTYKELTRKITTRQGRSFSNIFGGLQTGSRSDVTATVGGSNVNINEALSIADLEGGMRKLSGSFERFDISKHLNFSTADQAGALTQIEDFVKNVLIKEIIAPREAELKSKYEGYFANNETVKLNELIAEGRADTNIYSLASIKKSLSEGNESLISQIETLKAEIQEKGRVRPEALKGLTRTLSTLTDVLFIEMELSSALVRRSAPFGNPFVNENMHDRLSFQGLNQITAAAQDKYGRGRQMAVPVFGEEHNRSLLLLNPFTFLISDGGDFDGDTYSVILNDINRVRAKLSRDEARLSDLTVRTNTLSEKEESEKSSLERSISISRSHLAGLDSKHEEFKGKVAEYISQYTGTPKEFFLSKTEGGFLDKGLSVETIMSFIGGKFTGLYTIEGSYDGLNREFGEYIKEGYRQLSQRTDLTDPQTRVNFLQTVLTDPAQPGPIGKFVEKLSPIIGKEGINNFLSLINIGDVADPSMDISGLGQYVGKYNRMALNDYLKYSSKGVEGAPVTPEQYQMLQAVLGQAGSVILGKTYNNILGVYYSQAPSLALTDALLRDEQLRDLIVDDKLSEKTKEKIRNVMGLDSKVDITASTLVDLSRKTRQSSSGTSIFLQNIQQLLRDALKPPGDVSEFISGLTDQLESFRSAKTEEERNVITQRLAEDFGSGPGMKALMNLNYLSRNFESLNVTEDVNLEKAYNTLRTMGLSTEQIDDIAVQRLGLDGNLNAATEFGAQYRKYGATAAYQNIFGATSPYLAIAEYKAQQDLLNLSVFFSFDESRKGKLESSGVAFSDIHRQAFELINSNNTADLSPEALATRGELVRELSRYSAYTRYLEDRKDNIESLSRQSIYQDPVKFRQDLIKSGADAGWVESQPDHLLYTDFMETVELFGFAAAKDVNPKNTFERAILGHNALTKGSDEAARALYMTYMFKKKEQTNKFMGSMGENLVNLFKFNQTREIFYSNEFIKENPSARLDADSAIFAGLMAQGGGKINEQSIAGFFDTMIQAAKVQAKGKSITEEDVFMSVLNAPSLNAGDEHIVLRDIVKDVVGKEGFDGPFMQRYRKQIQATLFGQMHSTLAAYINNEPHSNYETTNKRDYMKDVLVNITGLSADSDFINSYLNNVETLNLQTTADSSEDAMMRYFRGNIPLAPGQQLLARSPRINTNGNPLLDMYNPTVDVAAQTLMLPLLGIVGQAIASGGITSDVVTQTVSGMLMGASYMRFSNFASPVTRPGSSKVLQSMALSASGVGFRLNTALTQAEHTGEEVGESITRMLINEVVTNVVVAGATEPAAKFFERKMGAKGNLDMEVDELNSLRGITSSIMGIATGALLGMAMNNVAQVAVQEFAGFEPSIIGSFIDSLAQVQRMTSGQGMELSEVGDEDAVVDEQGNIVPYITMLAERVPQQEDESSTSLLATEEENQLTVFN